MDTCYIVDKPQKIIVNELLPLNMKDHIFISIRIGTFIAIEDRLEITGAVGIMESNYLVCKGFPFRVVKKVS